MASSWRGQVVGLLTEIRDLLAQQQPDPTADDNGDRPEGRTEVTGD